ncbi:MAG: hypothetical protein B6U87_01770 [Candidatus Aenigmarchaeota archaeon ex4484_52]|nr:MAG: hypothetical protein B6U87_01770 [Candidatus Aenigmarchaeota archaeon ex4484_52]
MKQEQKINQLLNKVEKFSKEHKIDLSSDEDLSIAIMNLISIEEHLFFTASKTKKDKYFDILNEIREIRKELLKKIIKDYEGEVWCISKHLLASSMRLMEVGTKELNKGNKKQAKDLFSKAYDLYSLFWGLNLKLVDVGGVKKIDEKALNIRDKDKNSIFAKLGKIVQKALDCCKE